ncbi:MAG: tetratricopeptide repeat-containing sulfotransferase family protein [Woeseiaceae bacterium]
MMSSNSEFEASFAAAQKLHREGQLAEAEQAYRQLAGPGEQRERVLQPLVDLYLQSGHIQQAIETLVALVQEVPDSLPYSGHLAELLQTVGQAEAAIAVYERLLARQPDMADGHFSLAVTYKRNLQYQDAVRAYEKALALGIDRVEEVYSNLGVLHSDMRDAAKAKEMYERALEANADYVPALFNLAGLFDETGDRQSAIDIYERVLTNNPQHWDSLARLAQAQRVTDPEDELLDRLRAAVEQAGGDPLAQEGLYFALGKALDDVAAFEQASVAYTEANALGKRRNPPHDRQVTAKAFDELIALFDADWIERNTTESTASPIFVCGMFRSGSTLIDQMLGSHPEITAGGELEFLPWLIARNLGPYPQRVSGVSSHELQRIGEQYLSKTGELFRDAVNLTDKRPDNFLHLGLVKAMFPRARIVYTRREKRDTCLSIFFQQFGGNLSYAADVEDTADYYDQHVRLMRHWQACFGENIFTVDYDELVRSPEPVLRKLLEFLDVGWDARCLEFQRSEDAVKTASVWQVREGLHRTSSGRWRNYEALIPSLK